MDWRPGRVLFFLLNFQLRTPDYMRYTCRPSKRNIRGRSSRRRSGTMLNRPRARNFPWGQIAPDELFELLDFGNEAASQACLDLGSERLKLLSALEAETPYARAPQNVHRAIGLVCHEPIAEFAAPARHGETTR